MKNKVMVIGILLFCLNARAAVEVAIGLSTFGTVSGLAALFFTLKNKLEVSNQLCLNRSILDRMTILERHSTVVSAIDRSIQRRVVHTPPPAYRENEVEQGSILNDNPDSEIILPGQIVEVDELPDSPPPLRRRIMSQRSEMATIAIV